MDDLEAIKANAVLVLKTFGQQNLAYDEESVAWLDGYIERNRLNWDAQTGEKLANILGSFLGECIRLNFGGEWQMTEYGLGIAFSDGNVTFPFTKIRKQIRNGSEDSIADFYKSIPILFKN
ncbi:MAG TPA: hypothetical protein VK400_08370 [Pyrinomonadaceae bacterium]|nr:hypothetical protein [Pyrinomonadaceae bacterium]